MHRSTSMPALVVGCTALAGVPLLAQMQLSLPRHADAVDGHHKVSLPFGVPGFRTQILVDGASLAANGALLNGIAFRSDRPSAPLGPQQVPNVTVALSETSIAAGSLAETFATNVTGTPTVVFQGTVNLPASNPGFAGPQPWDVVITFPTPFLFTTSAGNLLIDITGSNGAGGTPTYHLDGVQGGGSASTFGTGGTNPTNDSLQLRVLSSMNNLEMDARRYSPGNTIEFVSFLGFTQPPGVLAIGTAPQPVPIDLTLIGAPTNFLYVDPLVLVPHSWSQWWMGWNASFALTVPGSPLLIGATLYGQSTVFEPAANALGIVFSGAVEVRIGDQLEQLPLQQLDSWDPASATGLLLDFALPLVGPDHGSTPVRFHGTFF